ncbi:MAG: hypothetical protein ABIG31_05890 [Candidatus Omnitrophota bacterium]
MKKIYLVALLMLCCLFKLAFASDTTSFAVSCTIPAIPGVNAPLLEQEQVQSSPETQEIIRQDAQVASASVASMQLVVKTYYAR